MTDRRAGDPRFTADGVLDGLRRFSSGDRDEVARALCDLTVRAGAPAAAVVEEQEGVLLVVAASGPLDRPLDLAALRTMVGDEAPSAPGSGVRWITAATAAPARLGTLRGFEVDRIAVLRVGSRGVARLDVLALWTSPSSGGEQPDAIVAGRMARLAAFAGLALDAAAQGASDRAATAHDDLTGLASRSAVLARLDAVIETGGASVAVLYADVNRFKRVNDSLGHAGGDAVLIQIGQRLRSAVGVGGTVGRLGGDEFLVVLPDGDDGAAVAVEERIAASMRHPFIVGNRTVYASVATGRAVAVLGQEAAGGPSAASLVQSADDEMYVAKRRTRAQRTADTHLDLLALEADLHEALDRDEITAWFQPQYDGRSQRLAGFEALARWQHPSLGWIAPGVLIPVAEEAGLIADVGARVLRHTFAFAEANSARFGSIGMNVNVSRRELLTAGHLDRMSGLMAGLRDDSWSLTLEVTEQDLAEEEGGALADALLALRSLGVAVAIDDFGSGSSSLRLLQDLPVTALKIDEAFLHRTGALGDGLIAAVVQLGRELGLEVMAEGIETAAQLAMLQQLECGRLQGFFLGAPAPAEVAGDAAGDIRAAVRSRQLETRPEAATAGGKGVRL